MHFYSVTFERFGTVGGLCKEFEQKYLVQSNFLFKKMLGKKIGSKNFGSKKNFVFVIFIVGLVLLVTWVLRTSYPLNSYKGHE